MSKLFQNCYFTAKSEKVDQNGPKISKLATIYHIFLAKKLLIFEY